MSHCGTDTGAAPVLHGEFAAWSWGPEIPLALHIILSIPIAEPDTVNSPQHILHTLKQDPCPVKKVRRCWSCPWHQTKPSSKGPFPSELPLGGQALVFQQDRNGHLPAPLQSWCCWHSQDALHCLGDTAEVPQHQPCVSQAWLFCSLTVSAAGAGGTACISCCSWAICLNTAKAFSSLSL